MTVIEELMATVRAQQHTIEVLTIKLEETNAKLDKANARIAELEEQLHKDSHNSSKPPSSDGYEKAAPKSQRKTSGKRAGGQTGHKGNHMMLGVPDRIETVYPQHCVNCPHRAHCDKLKVHDTCYTVDVEIRKETVKYEIMECNCGGVQEAAKRPAGISGSVTYGNRLKALVCVLSTKGMVAIKNLCEIIHGLTGIKPGTGTVCNMLHSAAAQAKTVVDGFPQELHKSPVVHCDETGLRVNGNCRRDTFLIRRSTVSSGTICNGAKTAKPRVSIFLTVNMKRSLLRSYAAKRLNSCSKVLISGARLSFLRPSSLAMK